VAPDVDLVALHRRAAERFVDVVRRVGPDQWHLPTPCTDWDVRALVAHNHSENLWVPPIMAGRTLEEVGDVFEGDHLGGDPASVYAEASEAACVAVEEPAALDRTVHLSMGDTTGADFVWQRLADLVVHRWDLLRGIGANEALEPDLVEAVYQWALPYEEMLASAPDFFDPPVEPADGADPQTKLLNLFGRRP
jgi:uncharacterized protein (TIGR03086 family)